MRKIFTLILLFFLIGETNCAFALNIGTYKAESEYGLIDGFKFNFFDRKEGQKWVELRSETKEEIERKEKERKRPPVEQDEYQLFRFIQDNTVAY